jgi:hypothetical protein
MPATSRLSHGTATYIYFGSHVKCPFFFVRFPSKLECV